MGRGRLRLEVFENKIVIVEEEGGGVERRERKMSSNEEKGSGQVAGQMYADTLTLEVVGGEQAWRFLTLETLLVEMGASLNRRMRCQH